MRTKFFVMEDPIPFQRRVIFSQSSLWSLDLRLQSPSGVSCIVHQQITHKLADAETRKRKFDEAQTLNRPDLPPSPQLHPNDAGPSHSLRFHNQGHEGISLLDRIDTVAPQVALKDDLTSSDDDDADEQWSRLHSCMHRHMSLPVVGQDSGWYKVRQERIDVNNAKSMTIGKQALFSTSLWLSNRMTITAFDAFLESAPAFYIEGGVVSDPSRVPKSKAACDQVLGVQPAERSEIHICWGEQCSFWWSGAVRCSRKVPGLCTCKDCACPKCNRSRFQKADGSAANRKSGHANLCYFFPEAIEQYFLDRVMCYEILKAHQDNLSDDPPHHPFYNSQRYKDLLANCTSAGWDREAVRPA